MESKELRESIRPDSHDIRLRYLGLSVKVTSSNADDIIWLKEFFCPQFEISDSSVYDCEIDFIVDDDYVENLLQNFSSSLKEINGFALDRKMVKLLSWGSERDYHVLFDTEFKVFYVIFRKNDKVHVVSRFRNYKSARTALMRVVREYAMNHANADGWHTLHSSAFTYQGQAILLAGEKNSGKTSLLIYLLRNLPSQFVSNDRNFLSVDGCRATVRGMPTVITIHEKTLTMFPQFQEAIDTYGFHHRLTVSEALHNEPSRKQLNKSQVSLTSAQFCRLLNVESCAQSKVSAIIFPRICDNASVITFEKLKRERAIQRLEEACFARYVSAPQSVFHLQNMALSPLSKGLSFDRFASDLATFIPCFDVFLGSNAYEGTDVQKLMNKLF